MTPAEAIALADQIEAEMKLRDQIGREMYRAGLEDGYRQGYAVASGEREAEHAAWWRDHGQTLVNRPTHAELEERRWGPGGRAHYGDPRPGDYPGRQPRAEHEAEADNDGPELEVA